MALIDISLAPAIAPSTEPAWSRDECEARLRDMGAGYHIHHPFNVMLNTVKSSKEQIQGWVALLGTLINYAVALATVSLVAALLYHFGPNRPKNWLAVWPGAMVATVLWLVVTSAFAWYVRNIADYNVLYGSIGAVIALLVWMYLLALVALIGCEFNAERERLSRIL